MRGIIYEIKNIENGHRYIGQTRVSLARRKSSHLASLRQGQHFNDYLQNAFNKYGEESFVFHVISSATTQEALNAKEIFYVRKIGDYNLAEGGLNQIKAPETRKKLSQNMTGSGNPMYGKKHSEESKQKMREARLGCEWSEESKLKLSESISGENNCHYIPYSLEEVKKMKKNGHTKDSVALSLGFSSVRSFGRTLKQRHNLVWTDIPPKPVSKKISIKKIQELKKMGFSEREVAHELGYTNRGSISTFLNRRGTTWTEL